MRTTLNEDLAGRFAGIALGHVTREYPNKLTHGLAGPEDARTPSALHPVFYGSFDWHSCVHAYWMLAHLLRRFPDMAPAAAVRDLFDRQLTPEKIAGECAYLAQPGARGFERPYGWAWLLKLAAELDGLPDMPWAGHLAPLAEAFVQRFRDFLPKATYPVRVGTHFNTAFGLRLAADHAEATGDAAFLALLRDTAERWYGNDEDCPAWGEPSGDDFLSPALIEAECMRRLLPRERFGEWFDRFLPRLATAQPMPLFRPAEVSDRSDGKIAHLDGLNLSRAWCWRALARGLPAEDPRRALMDRVADLHLAAGLPHVAGDYMGEHWLASFAVLALEAGEA
ncbi:DUF2891 domain-containing protein [Roseomonas sp. M0104]|uniref:DUF2891 domain-containing protein n=1 Tax=Teichococcus coralli TaxID=2545983 RepID=A0A845B7Z4_9PROT|nr:DUF2891 domain-containing protein [Pseudoroseomonas coralli]MXP62226.1 DUF2891 domain-containing protein [Pseudoroseomonas coralli]